MNVRHLQALAVVLWMALLVPAGLSSAESTAEPDPAASLRSGIAEVVGDPARAEAADHAIALGRRDLEDLGKRFEKIAKGFSSADGAQSAGLDELLPFMQQAFELRRTEQGKAVDRLFELRETLTEDEWSAFLTHLR